MRPFAVIVLYPGNLPSTVDLASLDSGFTPVFAPPLSNPMPPAGHWVGQ